MDMHASNFHKSSCCTNNRHDFRVSLVRHRSFSRSKAGYRQCCRRLTSARSDHQAFEHQESPTAVPNESTVRKEVTTTLPAELALPSRVWLPSAGPHTHRHHPWAARLTSASLCQPLRQLCFGPRCLCGSCLGACHLLGTAIRPHCSETAQKTSSNTLSQCLNNLQI